MEGSHDRDRLGELFAAAASNPVNPPSQQEKAVVGRASRRFCGSVATPYLEHMSGAGATIGLGIRAVP